MELFVAHVLKAILLVFYSVFSLLPTKNRIVCISRQSDDKPLDFVLIAEHLKKTRPDLETVILAKAMRGMASYAFHMVKQVYYIATSKAVVLDSYCIAVSLLSGHIKVPVIQIWHAMGNMKKFGYSALDEPEGRKSSTAKAFKMHAGYDRVLISSKSFVADFAEGFGCDPSIIEEAPLPKTDLLVDPAVRAARRQELLEAWPQLGTKKNIVYCPTFRKSAAGNEEDAMRQLVDAIDSEKYNLIFMKHPVSTQAIDDPRVFQGSQLNASPLYLADYIISDYSTVIYEAGLLEVPVYLYAYDWDTYSGKRGLNIDIQHDVPTLFTDNPREIVRAIEQNDFDAEAYRRFIHDNVAVPSDETCSERVCRLILSATKRGCSR